MPTNPLPSRADRADSGTWLRLLLGLAVALAVVATALLVFSSEARWLRFAVLAALWAALIGAFAVARSHREARVAELRQEEGRKAYELELQREVSARLEYEIHFADTVRQEADASHRAELDALREQVERLSDTLAGLFDGELMVQRLTLSAESTRVRQVGDGARSALSAAVRSQAIEVSAQQAVDADLVDEVVVKAAAPDVPGKSVVAGVAGGAPAQAVPEPETVAAELVDPEPAVETVAAEPVDPEPAVEAVAAEPVVPEPAVEAVAEEPAVEAVAEEPAAEGGPVQGAQPDEAAGTGHSAGVSVADLVAAYGNTGRPHRRRRESD